MKSSNSSKSGSNQPRDLVRIGEIVAPHGIRGGIKVFSHAESNEFYAPGRSIVLIDPAGGRRELRITASGAGKGSTVRLFVEQVDTRELAEKLVGCAVFVPRTELPALEEDTYYWADLIGLEVVTAAGEILGRIESIIPTGANDVYVVRKPDSRPQDEILVPAVASVVLSVDLGAGRMTVELPDGLRP